MDWISKPVALWDWDNPLPPPSVAVTVAPSAGTGDELSGDPLSSVEGSSVVDAQPSPAPAMVVGAPQLGLGLGKRTYFEGEKKGEKKGGGGGHVQGTRCQVEGCGADLSSAKDYHRKHRVCEAHSKCPRVVVSGQERRFCQQCSRFHALSEFDQKKRSCRRRLSDHNARRRKPQPDSFSFGSTRLSSSFYDERRQISFMWNKAPFSLMRQPSWAESDFKISNSNDFKFLNSKEFCIKQSKEGCGQVLQLGSINNNNNINNNNRNPNSSPNPNLVNPNTSVEVDGLSLLEGAPDLRRALSLLSSPAMQNSHTTPPPPPHPSSNNLLQFSSTDPHSVTLASNSAAYWMDDQQAASFSVQNGVASTTGGLHLQEFQLLKPAVQYETAAFFDSSQIR